LAGPKKFTASLNESNLSCVLRCGGLWHLQVSEFDIDSAQQIFFGRLITGTEIDSQSRSEVRYSRVGHPQNLPCPSTAPGLAVKQQLRAG
jgi:hypothetical protein